MVGSMMYRHRLDILAKQVRLKTTSNLLLTIFTKLNAADDDVLR